MRVDGISLSSAWQWWLSLVLVISGAVFMSGCESTTSSSSLSDDPCSSNYVDIFENNPDARLNRDGEGVIGPEGGVVEIADPAGLLPVGLKVSVPAGAWSECWEVGIFRTTSSLTPDYPVGYVNFEDDFFFGAPSVEIRIYRWTPDFETYDAPDSMYFEVSFPVQNIPQDKFELFAAFFYDDTGESWRVKFPDALDQSVLTVRTSKWKQPWSWGRVDLVDIDFEEHLEPALRDRVGTETWNEIMASVSAARADAAAALGGGINCVSLDVAAAIFGGFVDVFGSEVRRIQAGFNGDGEGQCRLCDATTGEFFEDLTEYVKLYIGSKIVDDLGDNADGALATIATFALGVYLEAAMESLACDYECLVERAPPEFYVNTAGYWVSRTMVAGIQVYKDLFTNCPLAAEESNPLVGFSPEAGTACTLSASALAESQE